MNKKLLVATIALLIILVLSSVMYFTLKANHKDAETVDATVETSETTTEEPETDDGSSSNQSTVSTKADSTLASFANINEPITLYSRVFKQGETRDNNAPSLGWDENLEMCVTNAEILEYDETDDYDGMKEIWANQLSDHENPVVLKINLSLKNIDAENRYGVKYEFSSSMFRLGAYEDLIPDNYNNYETYVPVGEHLSVFESAISPHADGSDYYKFELEAGETKEFTLRFLIDGSYLSQKGIFLGVTANRVFDYGVLLTDLQK